MSHRWTGIDLRQRLFSRKGRLTHQLRMVPGSGAPQQAHLRKNGFESPRKTGSAGETGGSGHVCSVQQQPEADLELQQPERRGFERQWQQVWFRRRTERRQRRRRAAAPHSSSWREHKDSRRFGDSPYGRQGHQHSHFGSTDWDGSYAETNRERGGYQSAAAYRGGYAHGGHRRRRY